MTARLQPKGDYITSHSFIPFNLIPLASTMRNYNENSGFPKRKELRDGGMVDSKMEEIMEVELSCKGLPDSSLLVRVVWVSLWGWGHSKRLVLQHCCCCCSCWSCCCWLSSCWSGAQMDEHSHAHWSALSEFGQCLHDYVQKHSYVREQELLPGW